MPEALEEFSWIDVATLVLILGLAITGAIKGAIRFIVGTLTLIVGIVLAGRYGGDLGAETWHLIKDLDNAQRVGVLVGCGLLFAVTLLLGALLARTLRKAAEDTDLGGIDRFFGFVFGALRAALVAGVAMIFIMAFDIEPISTDARSSYTLEYTRRAVDSTRSWFPVNVEHWLADALELPPPSQPPR